MPAKSRKKPTRTRKPAAKPRAAAEASAIAADARNRFDRTFVQGIAIDVAVAVAVTVYALVTSPDPVVWAVVPASLARTVVQAAAAYIMRRFVDQSRIPTPRPPGNSDTAD